MVKKTILILLNIIIVVILGFLLFTFYNKFQNVQNVFVKTGVFIILFFTLIVISRYMLLLYFSIIKLIMKTSDEKNIQRVKTNFKVTIIVPAYNEEKVLPKSLPSLIAQTHPNIEILVVDDGSTDLTYQIAKNYEFESDTKSLKVLTKPNSGKANAINYGIKHANGELIMVVDADSRLEKNAVELMAQYFLNPEVAAVAGSVYVSNQNNLLTKLQALEYIEGLNMVRNGQAFLKLVNIIPGPIGMFRKDALYDVGLYDDDTFAEDCDVTLKLISKGYKIDFESDAVAYTEAPEHFLDLIKQRYRWTRGILQAIKKHKYLLWHFRKNPAASFTMWYMLFESVFWPFMDVWTNFFIIYLSIVSGVSILIFFWWVMFTILDMAGALYCVLVTGEKLSLVFYAVFYRLFFIEFINITKILSTFEEWFGIEMTWGKLERKGNL
jgi:cellulose synthase/poly-beta-1,6-N-acetylglucosamine synthase-like glycosyltransferase